MGEGQPLFDLRRTEQNKDAWTTLLCRKGDSFFSRSVPVTVGFDNGIQVASVANSVSLIRVDELWFKAFAVIAFLLFLLFLYFATESDIHRDTGPQPGKSRKTYSPCPYADGSLDLDHYYRLCFYLDGDQRFFQSDIRDSRINGYQRRYRLRFCRCGFK